VYTLPGCCYQTGSSRLSGISWLAVLPLVCSSSRGLLQAGGR
jgi:hypothetical protein